jgi:hypothetical protein
MIGAYLLCAAALVLFGAAGGFVVVVSLASHRDKDITSPTTDRIHRGARVATRLHTRGPSVLHEAAYRHNLPRPTGREQE